MKTIHPIIRTFAVIVMLGAAAVVRADGDSGQAGAFLRYGVGGRALGMGRAFTAVSNDASGVYWNPAGLVGAKQFEIATMYSNLFYDSRYSHFGVVIPRPFENPKNSILRFLAGPSSAIGIGWVGFGMVGFEQRSRTGERLGDFGIQENAFSLAWAREEMGGWAALRYGVGLKLVNQNFSGLQDWPGTDAPARQGRDWSAGMDAGITLQFIHLPVLRAIALPYLLPFRLGASVQNLVRPDWSFDGGGKDPFPRVWRIGMGYTWVLKDWIPKTWGSVQQWVGRTEILTVIDWEWMHGSETGVYFGCEGHIPVVGTGLTWFPRFGFNNRTEGASFGAGLFIPFSGAYNLGMDYAYLVHPNLPNDSRIFLTFRLGPAKDAVFFRKLHRQQEGDRRYLFNILSDYPNAEINGTVKILAEMDKRHADRYFGLLEGLERAEWLYARSVALLKANEIKKSKDKASDAAMEFQAQFGRQDENPLSDDQLLHYSEMLILTGRMADADSVLQEIRQPSLHSHFLSGTSHKGLGHWDAAIGHFKQALAIIDTRYRDEPAVQSIDGLAALGLAESWLMRGLSSGNDTTSINNALLFLDDILSHPAARLDSDYPRYPVFNDGYCIDDAQLLKGITLVMAGRIDEGVAALLETNRFYSILDNGRISRSIEDRLIGLLQDGDVEGIIGLARDLLATYAKSHALAVSGEP